ncbi:MAG: HEAT repeat domain-containing protein [Pseudomonadota bacterium]
MKRTFFPLIVLVLLMLGWGQIAEADRIDRLIQILQTDPSYKVRLQVALTLVKLKDNRAVPVLISTLNDENHTVRGIAAGALGQMGDIRALSPLLILQASEKHHFVKAQISKAIKAIKSKRFLIRVGKMANTSGRGGPELSRLFGQELLKEFGKVENVATDWGVQTTEVAELSKLGIKAFVLDGAIISFSQQKKGESAEVSCNVRVSLATYPENSLKAFYTGGTSMEVPVGDLEQQKELDQDLIVAAAQGAKEYILRNFLNTQ